MSAATKLVDPAFHGVGHKVGTEIWRIENFQPVPLPKSDYGKFYTGDSYIVFQTTSGKSGGYLYDIHFWIGNESSQDEAGTAAIKTVELDTILGGRAVQHRELQGFESDKFLSYFKPCIIPLEGGFASGFRKPEEEKFETRLYVCKGKRVVKVKQVPFARSSLNHDDVFVLDTENKIYQFNGANSNIQERGKALEVVQYMKDTYHDGKCDIAIIDDGKLQAESDSGEFWVLFGGFAPIGKKVVNEDEVVPESTPAKLYSINDGQLILEESELSKSKLENNKCYLLDCGAEIFIWVGRVTQVDERKTASKVAEDFIINENRPKTTHVTQVIQGHETHSFKSNFESWPVGTGPSGGEDGRGKVAALLKQQGVDVKGITKGPQMNEEIPPLLETGGKLEVWIINESAKELVSKEDIGKFYSGDCYIVLYTYHSGERKEDYFLTCWIGKDSIEDDQMMATQLANKMWSSLKGRPVQGRIYQGKEPPQFIALFQPMVVLKGGVSSGYKNFIADSGVNDETYTSDCIALIQVSGTSVHNNNAIQVDAVYKATTSTLKTNLPSNVFHLPIDLCKVATSLSSNDCFFLQSGNTLFIWNGSSSTFEQQQWAAHIADFLKPGVTLKHAKEGTESSTFWSALGGKQNFTSKKIKQDVVRDPHLYTYSLKKGKLEVTEVFNYSQDDLLTEDMLLLDTHVEIFVWIGYSVDSEEKQKAFEIGQKYIELAVAIEGLSPNVPLYKVTEGNEPCFFTTYFSWDSTKATVQGNTFQKKLSYLFGSVLASESKDKSSGVQHDGPTQRASALAALTSAFNPTPNTKTPTQKSSQPNQGSQRAAAVAALSTVLTAEQIKAQSEASTGRHTSPSPSAQGTPTAASANAETEDPELEHPPELSAEKEEATEADDSVSEHNEEDSEATPESEIHERVGESIFSYDRLKANSSDPATGIDHKRREAYLSDDEFETIFGMNKEAFYQQPKWKQDMAKKKVQLF